MTFGERVRQLRKQRGLTQRDLAKSIGVSDTYISKVENDNLHFGDYPSEKFIHKLAAELEAEEDELLLLTERVPEAIRKRVRENPEAFRLLATMSDDTLEELLARHRTEKTGTRILRREAVFASTGPAAGEEPSPAKTEIRRPGPGTMGERRIL